jgi:hypothetical protein
MRTRWLAVLVAASFLIAPAAGAQSGDDRETDRVTFYGHVFGHGLGQPMPANTIPPDGEAIYGRGTSNGYCSSAAPDAVLASCEDVSWNKLAVFSSPGPVPVDDRPSWVEAGTYSAIHNERGQTLDVQLDSSESVTAGIYLTYDMHGWFVGTGETSCLHPHPQNAPCVYPYWGWDPGVFENVVVEGTLYAGELGEFQGNASNQPPVQQAIEDGDAEPIATGQWGPDTVMNGVPSAPNAMHFQLDLGQPDRDVIEKSEDFFLVYETYQDVNGENAILDNPVRWWSGEFFPHTFELPVQNAITVEQVVPSFTFGQLAMVGVVTPPWGSYDVDEQSLEFEIENADTGQTVTPDDDYLLDLPLSQSLAHGGHYNPVNKTAIWDYRGEGLDAGTYEVTLEASNLQGTATHQCSATFTIEEDANGAPVPGETNPGTCGNGVLTTGEAAEVAQEAQDEDGGS